MKGPGRSRSLRGFTLLELLSAAAVFVLLLTMLLQMTGGVSEMTARQARRMNATAEARAALDTLAQDLSVLVRENGATLLFEAGDERTNDALRFLCLARPAPGATKPRLTLVSYGIESRRIAATGKDAPMLVRGTAPAQWPLGDESVVADYDFEDVLARKIATGHVAAEGVFRFEILWLCKDGAFRRVPPTAEGISANAPSAYRRIDLSQVSGFMVTVACLDRTNREIAADFGYTALQSAFPASPEAEAAVQKSPLERWNAGIAQARPARVRDGVRLVQRTFLLPQ